MSAPKYGVAGVTPDSYGRLVRSYAPDASVGVPQETGFLDVLQGATASFAAEVAHLGRTVVGASLEEVGIRSLPPRRASVTPGILGVSRPSYGGNVSAMRHML
jgi:hypothetical protein